MPMLEIGGFSVTTGGFVVKDPRQDDQDNQVAVQNARPGFWNAYVHQFEGLTCSLILVHESVNLAKNCPDWQESLGEIELKDDSIGIYNGAKVKSQHDDILAGFTAMMAGENGFVAGKFGVAAVAGESTSDCTVYVDTDAKERVIAVKVEFWDEKEEWDTGDEDEGEDDSDSYANEYAGCLDKEEGDDGDE